MTTKQKTVIVTGASQGIGAAVANLFLDRGYNVVGNSRSISRKNELQSSDKLALVDGDIGLASTAETIVGTALKRFGSVDALVNNAGIFFAKPFTEYTREDFRGAVLHQLGWLYPYDTIGRETDALAKERRQCGEHHEFYCRSSACGVDRIRGDDHQGWYRCDIPESRHGICAEGHSCERGGSRRRGYSAAQE